MMYWNICQSVSTLETMLGAYGYVLQIRFKLSKLN